MQKIFLLLVTACLFLSFSGTSGRENRDLIRVLLISGKNNHEWQKTSPLFARIMEEDGCFKVTVTERPDTLKAVDLKTHKVIVSNWNAFPESSRQWGETAEKAIMDFVNGGGGFVLFPAAGASHYDWPEYQEMVGATWGKNTRHGAIETFEVKVADHRRDQDEPVVICRKQRKGRCFYLVLGHDETAMKNPDWKMLIRRGTEWAATGKVMKSRKKK